jgi:fumarate hydratase subunit alpha
MRSRVVEATVRALRHAETSLPGWVLQMIRDASEQETNPTARSHLQFMLENVRIAEARRLPLCQDTGLPIFRVEMGRDLKLDFDLRMAIEDGVRIATLEIPLRPNAVDPLTRQNSGDNTGAGMPDIVLDLVEGNGLCITAFPNGAGGLREHEPGGHA